MTTTTDFSSVNIIQVKDRQPDLGLTLHRSGTEGYEDLCAQRAQFNLAATLAGEPLTSITEVTRLRNTDTHQLTVLFPIRDEKNLLAYLMLLEKKGLITSGMTIGMVPFYRKLMAPKAV